jgi:spore maturation protein CgeB
MKSLAELADTMRADWNRRVQHDYRFWVSNDLSPRSIMWEEGSQDFERLHGAIESHVSQTALEIGCGVGRMLRAAAKRYGQVIGVDISPSAIDKARELLGIERSIQLVSNSGYDLRDIPDASIDFVWSFASLAHMPLRVIASYLVEIRRVLRASGCAKLQLFLGPETHLSERDSLRLRAFPESRLREALRKAGLSLQSSESVDLPLSEFLDEMGLSAYIVTICPGTNQAASVEEVARALNPDGESDTASTCEASQFEAWLAMHYADRLYQDGEFDRARAALEYVAQHCHAAGIDIRDALDRVSQATERDTQGAPVYECSKGDFYDRNLGLIKDRFPLLYQRLVADPSTPKGAIEVRASHDGPVLWNATTCLDHAEKPKAAADVWVKRSLNEPRYARAQHLLVLGFGAGYHIESLLSRGTHKISCIEPSVASLKAALASRDMTAVLEGVTHLGVTADAPAAGWGTEVELLIRPQSAALYGDFCDAMTSAFYAHRGLSALHPKIAVLGPLHGGTQPIGQYTTAALTRLGQHTRGIDMSGFNGAFELVGSLLSDKSRIALARQTYTETLSSFLLESFSEKPIDILICMAQAPITPRALTELRRRGVITVLWFLEDYLRFTYWRDVAQYYDYVFTIQKGDCIEAIRRAGAGQVHYLPAACDPHLHTALTLSPEDRVKWGSPISFVGAGYYNRQQAFAGLSHYPFKIWGSEWPLCKPFDKLVQEHARRIAPEEYVKIFNATDININLHSSSERDGVDPTGDFINPRTFELASCEAFQLVDERSLLSEAFEIGEEIVTFRSIPDLKEKIHYYLERPEERQRIARRGRQRVLREHTYEKRLEQMLSVIYAHSYQKLQQREKESPWFEMIRRAAFEPELRERCERACARGNEPTLDGLVVDIATGKGQLTPTEQKLLFLHHVRKQIVRMESEGAGVKN